MKLAVWIGAFVAVGLLALILGGKNQRMSALEARAEIAALGDEPEFDLIQTEKIEGSAVLGSRIEKKLRNLLRIRERETPCVIEDYYFRDPTGSFCVQLLDREGEEAVITVYGGPEASSGSGKLLRTTLPDAIFSGLALGTDRNAEQGGADQPATAAESRPEGKEKPQPETKPVPR